jgi:hypothetical protein
MREKRKLPGVPSMVPRKYHHEIKCVFQDFQTKIIADILKDGNLDDKAFLSVIRFSSFQDTPTGVLKMIKDIKGNSISKRLFELRTKD